MKATIVVNMDGPAFGPTADLRTLQLLYVVRIALRDNPLPYRGSIKLKDSEGATCGRLTVSK